jgi:hypothetical protein
MQMQGGRTRHKTDAGPDTDRGLTTPLSGVSGFPATPTPDILHFAGHCPACPACPACKKRIACTLAVARMVSFTYRRLCFWAFGVVGVRPDKPDILGSGQNVRLLFRHRVNVWLLAGQNEPDIWECRGLSGLSGQSGMVDGEALAFDTVEERA